MEDRRLHLIYNNGVKNVDLNGRSFEAFSREGEVIVKISKAYSDENFMVLSVKETLLQITYQLEEPAARGTYCMELTVNKDIEQHTRQLILS